MFRRFVHTVERLVCRFHGHEWIVKDDLIEPLKFKEPGALIELLILTAGAMLLFRNPVFALPLLGGFRREKYCSRCGKLEAQTIVQGPLCRIPEAKENR